MPKGDLIVIRMSDGEVIASHIPTRKSGEREIEKDMRSQKQHTNQSYIIAPFSSTSTYSIDSHGEMKSQSYNETGLEITNNSYDSSMMDPKTSESMAQGAKTTSWGDSSSKGRYIPYGQEDNG